MLEIIDQPARIARWAGDAIILIGCGIVWLGTKVGGYGLSVRFPAPPSVIKQELKAKGVLHDGDGEEIH